MRGQKVEASRTIRSDVDFVLTFEEVIGMFEAKAINFAEIAGDEGLNEATADGRGFAVCPAGGPGGGEGHQKPGARARGKGDGGPGASAQKMLMLAKGRQANGGYLLEGSACPGGCVAGAGTL